jgi:hypothetical protein
MQMLHAGGVPCEGTPPDFEDDRSGELGFDQDWFAGLRGCAVKILEPHRLPLAAAPKRHVIWLTRNPAEQARSMLKMIHVAFPSAPVDRRARRAMEASIERDEPRGRQAALGIALSFLPVRFEQLIEQPRTMANRLSAFCAPFGYALDPVAMAAVVRRRPSRCLAYMMEVEIVA